MATGVASWSQTAASNSNADSSVNWAEGMAPAAVNNSARGQMASVAKYRDDTAGSLTTAGTSTAYTLTTNQGFATLAALSGNELTVRFDQANGASATLNVDSLGAKALQVDASNAVPTGMIAADSIWRVTYDNSVPAFILNGVAVVFDGVSVTTTGDATIGGDAAVTGDVTAANVTTTTDVTVGGDLAVTGDVAINTNKFTITGSNGDFAAAGTGSITGELTANNAAGVVAKNTAKAFAYFTVSGGTVSFTASTQGFNIASVTRTGSSVYNIAFTTALANTNYAVLVTATSGGTSITGGNISNRATTGFTITFYRASTDTGADPAEANFLVFGL